MYSPGNANYTNRLALSECCPDKQIEQRADDSGYRRTSGEQTRYSAFLPLPAFTVAGTVGLPGGVRIWAGKERVGAVGVSGSAEPPPGKDSGVLTRSRSADEQCAMAGITKLAAKLK